MGRVRVGEGSGKSESGRGWQVRGRVGRGWQVSGREGERERGGGKGESGEGGEKLHNNSANVLVFVCAATSLLRVLTDSCGGWSKI